MMWKSPYNAGDRCEVPDPLLHRIESCPTCGQKVQIATSDEGTSHYVGIDAWDANTLRNEREDAIASATLGLAQTLRLIRDTCPSSAASNMARGALERAGIEDPEDNGVF